MNLSEVLGPWENMRQRSYDPAFQNTNNDASIGASGVAKGTYRVTNKQLDFSWFWAFGVGVTLGTGDLLLPLPPGFSIESFNFDAIVNVGGSIAFFGPCSGSLMGIPAAYDATWGCTPLSPIIALENPLLTTGVQAGDQIGYIISLPLR